MTTVVLITGLGRSGSTVLEALLTEHLGAVAVGEVRYLWERGLLRGELCSCGRPVPQCPFWSAVMDHAGDLHRAPDRTMVASLQHELNRNRRLLPLLVPMLRGRGLRQRLDEFARVMPPVYDAIAEVSGRGVIIDSSKHPAFGLAMLSVPGIRLVVVHLVRDSRGVVHSWQRRRRRPEVHWAEEYMDQLPPMETAVTWVLHNVASEVLGHRCPSYLRVRYEDFVVDPQPTLDRVATLCATGGSPAPAEAPVVHSVAGNPLRFGSGPLKLSLDMSWCEAMPRGRRLAVTAITAPMLVRYGYPLRVRGSRARSRAPRAS